MGWREFPKALWNSRHNTQARHCTAVRSPNQQLEVKFIQLTFPRATARDTGTHAEQKPADSERRRPFYSTDFLDLVGVSELGQPLPLHLPLIRPLQSSVILLIHRLPERFFSRSP